MKKLLLSLAFLPTLALAQTATLQVKLNPIMSIEVNTPQVLAEFNTKADYIDGVEVLKPNHLTTFATQGYKVSVKALSAEISNVTMSGESNFTHVTYNPVNLTETPQEFFSSPIGGGLKTHDVTYRFGDDYKDRAESEYTMTIQYEITAR